MKYCYVRKSTDKQLYDRQIDILIEKGYIDKENCQYILETYTGRSLKRPEFSKLLEKVNKGDTIIVESLSRLSRGSLYATIEIITDLIEKKEVNITLLKENLYLKAGNNMDAITKLILGFFTIVSAFERDINSERTKEGLYSARKNGKKLGRPQKPDSIKRYLSVLEYIIKNNSTIKESLDVNNFNKPYFYTLTNRYKQQYKVERLSTIYKKLKKEVQA